MTQLSYRDWLKKAETEPSVWPEPAPPQTLIRLRCIPAVYAQHAAHIEDGEAFATISGNSSVLRFPSPYGLDGRPTPPCRSWLTEVVAQAVVRDGYKRMIIWPERTFTSFNEAGEAAFWQAPSGKGDDHG